MNTILQAPSYVPPTVAQQIFVIGIGIAGGAAGLLLAREFTKVEDVPSGPLIIATLVSSALVLGAALYLANASRRY